jgi:hypothetical protein
VDRPLLQALPGLLSSAQGKARASRASGAWRRGRAPAAGVPGD